MRPWLRFRWKISAVVRATRAAIFSPPCLRRRARERATSADLTRCEHPLPGPPRQARVIACGRRPSPLPGCGERFELARSLRKFRVRGEGKQKGGITYRCLLGQVCSNAVLAVLVAPACFF